MNYERIFNQNRMIDDMGFHKAETHTFDDCSSGRQRPLEFSRIFSWCLDFVVNGSKCWKTSIHMQFFPRTFDEFVELVVYEGTNSVKNFQSVFPLFCKEHIDGGNSSAQNLQNLCFTTFWKEQIDCGEKFFPHRDGVRVKLKNGRKGASCHPIPISEWSCLWHCYDKYKKWDLVFGYTRCPKLS